MSIRFSLHLFSCLVSLALLAIPASAQISAPEIVQCSFGAGGKASDLTLILPQGMSKSRTQSVNLSVIPSTLGERSAVAHFTPAREAPISHDFIRILFKLEDEIGFVAQVAHNGDSYAFPINLDVDQIGEGFLGTCTNTPALFALWR